jgi:hypothetical protein
MANKIGCPRGTRPEMTVLILPVVVVIALVSGCDGSGPGPDPSSTTSPVASYVPPATTTTSSSTTSSSTTPPSDPGVSFDFGTSTGDIVVGVNTSIRGTLTKLPAGQTPWLLIRPQQAHQYHPQNSGPLAVQPDGAWTASCQFGTAQVGSGQVYDVILVAASAQASKEFAAYLKGAKAAGYPGMVNLPTGTTVLKTVEVRRQ